MNILVVAAHPDDEILGVGGTIAKKIKEGHKAYALIMAEGQTSRWNERADADKNVVYELHKDSYVADEIIGYTKTYFCDLPDNRMDSCVLLDIVKKLEKYIKEINPDIIYTHHCGDLNIDHRLTCEAVVTATRPIGDYSVKEIYAFQTVSSTEWNYGCKEESFYPNVFEDIDDYFEIKCRAMEAYTTELCDFPHPRSIKMLDVLSSYWGSTVGLNRAEAFELIRKVN